MKKEFKILPLIPLRNLIIFPHMVIHFDVEREKSIKALEEAMVNNQEIMLVGQKSEKEDEPKKDDLFAVGTVCIIKQILKLPGTTVRILAEGVHRGKISKFVENDTYIKANIEVLKDKMFVDEQKSVATTRMLKKSFAEYAKLSRDLSADSIIDMNNIDDLSRFSDVIASFITMEYEKKQVILEMNNVEERAVAILSLLTEEIDILKVEKKIGMKVKKNLEQYQQEFYLREQIKVIQEELGEDEQDELEKYKRKIVKMKCPKHVKQKVHAEIEKLKRAGVNSPENPQIHAYLDWIMQIPWSEVTEENLELKVARQVLENEHYGLEDVKERIIEYLAVRKMSDSLNGPIICLVGPPGVGKTSIAKSIAHALNRNFVRMSLGGVRDEAEIRGHRRTYVGAIPGRIIAGLKQAKSMNPLFLLDEIDKMSNDFRGDPSDALLEVLDSEQNNTFRDHYLELEIDLSKVLFLTTANSLDTIPRPLLDRMEVIEVSGYTSEEKYNIAKKYLIPKKLKDHGVDENKISFLDSALNTLIEGYTKESGVRSLERKISSIIRKAITEIIEREKESISITSIIVKKYLGPEIFTYDKIDIEDKVGIVTGMAWTGYGGDTLPVEVSVMNGTGKLELTGQLGDVMKESAKTGYSFVRANAEKYGINKEFYKDKDLHIHVPEGAVPKDGPSAGVTMITAMVSALSGKKVRHNIAMTGETTLTGRVIPIGGLKEKVLAAHRAGVDTIIIPKDNEKDLLKIPKTIKNKLKFILAEKIDDVLIAALID